MLNYIDRVVCSVRVSAGDGDNEVKFDQATLNVKLAIVTGIANDRVSVMDSTVVGTVSISTGAGADGVALKSVAARSDVSVNAGTNPQFDGNEDRIGVAGGTARNMTLDGGDSGRNDKLPGQAEIGVTGIAINGNLTIKTGHARGKVGLGDDPELIKKRSTLLDVDLTGASGRVTIGNVASIFTGLGADLVGVRNASAKIFKLDAGDGNDQAFIRDVAPALPLGKMQVDIKMGNGNDLLVLAGVINLADFSAASIDGGAGWDTLPGGKDWTRLVFKNWESYDIPS